MPSQGKRTEVYEARITKARGYHLVLAKIFSRKHVRKHRAFECLSADCHWDFRLVWPPSTPGVAEHGCQVYCPKCASVYVEWLSFGVAPEDVFLDTDEEWDLVPDGAVKTRTDRIQT